MIRWLVVAAALASASLYVLNKVAPSQGESRVRAHCAVGLASVALALYDAAGTGGGLGGGISLGLMLVTSSTGMILRFLPNTGAARYHASSLHSPLALALLLALLASLLHG